MIFKQSDYGSHFVFQNEDKMSHRQMLDDSAYYRLIHQEISIKLTSTRFKALDPGNPVVSNVEP